MVQRDVVCFQKFFELVQVDRSLPAEPDLLWFAVFPDFFVRLLQFTHTLVRNYEAPAVFAEHVYIHQNIGVSLSFVIQNRFKEMHKVTGVDLVYSVRYNLASRELVVHDAWVHFVSYRCGMFSWESEAEMHLEL